MVVTASAHIDADVNDDGVAAVDDTVVCIIGTISIELNDFFGPTDRIRVFMSPPPPGSSANS